ncbi:MAG: hypothetical protein NVV73_11230 [Cellvibrionaceae bacterium]|nr:hypothetical protein [Cellvibrionaceae bacterium]
MTLPSDFQPAHPKGRTRANATLAIGLLAVLAGLLLVIAPGANLLFFTIPSKGEFIGVTFVILGLFNIQEAQNQKRYLRLMARLRNREV